MSDKGITHYVGDDCQGGHYQDSRIATLERQLVKARKIVKQEIQHKHGPWKCDPQCYSHQILAILGESK